jgi:hypothetical protein
MQGSSSSVKATSFLGTPVVQLVHKPTRNPFITGEIRSGALKIHSAPD